METLFYTYKLLYTSSIISTNISHVQYTLRWADFKNENGIWNRKEANITPKYIRQKFLLYFELGPTDNKESVSILYVSKFFHCSNWVL